MSDTAAAAAGDRLERAVLAAVEQADSLLLLTILDGAALSVRSMLDTLGGRCGCSAGDARRLLTWAHDPAALERVAIAAGAARRLAAALAEVERRARAAAPAAVEERAP